MTNFFVEPPKSTYKTSYQTYTPMERMKPKFHELPSLVDQPDVLQPPREFPIEPEWPKRPHSLEHAPAPGLGSQGVHTLKLLNPKGITKTPAPQDVNYPQNVESHERRLIPSPQLDRLPVIRNGVFRRPLRVNLDIELANQIVKDGFYLSTAARAARECPLPMWKVTPPSTTLEPKADMVRLKAQKYENQVEEWQRVPLWDKYQPRGWIRPDDARNPAWEIAKKNMKSKAQREAAKDVERSKKIKDLVEADKLSSVYVLQRPGYAGFMPRSPTGQPMEQVSIQPNTMSSSLATHRKYPTKEYHYQRFGRLGSMSKTVTLTYPYNPYNKIEEDTEFGVSST